MIQRIKKILATSIATYRRLALTRCELIKIKKYAPMWKATPLTTEEEQAFKAVWGGVKYKIDDRWHRYYKYFTGKFDANYIPEIIFSVRMEPRIRPRGIAEVVTDKALVPIIYGNIEGLYIPRTVVVNCSGIYYNGEGNPITETQAKRAITNYLSLNGKAIIKPTIGSSSGRNVKLINNISECVEYKQNWIVQEVIKNQDDIAALNPSSLNTFRVITFIVEDKICFSPIILRMGVGDTHVDNAHAGGIFIGVNDDGSLCDEAYSNYGEKHIKHPHSKIVFAGYKIKNFDKIKEVAVQCHKKTPHMNMISFDLTINQEGKPTLIEVNLKAQAVWLSQIAHGKSVFREHASYMIEKYL